MDGWVDGLVDGWMDRWMDECGGWVSGWMDGWMGGWKEGYGWMDDRQTLPDRVNTYLRHRYDLDKNGYTSLCLTCNMHISEKPQTQVEHPHSEVSTNRISI